MKKIISLIFVLAIFALGIQGGGAFTSFTPCDEDEIEIIPRPPSALCVIANSNSQCAGYSLSAPNILITGTCKTITKELTDPPAEATRSACCARVQVEPSVTTTDEPVDDTIFPITADPAAADPAVDLAPGPDVLATGACSTGAEVCRGKEIGDICTLDGVSGTCSGSPTIGHCICSRPIPAPADLPLAPTPE